MKKTRALIDPKTEQVACVILQAVAGGDRSVVALFDDWATSPSPDMTMVAGTPDEWANLAKLWNGKQELRK